MRNLRLRIVYCYGMGFDMFVLFVSDSAPPYDYMGLFESVVVFDWSQSAALEADYDVVVLTETWLDPSLPTALLFGEAHCVYRCDRNAANSSLSRGGGVLIAVSSALRSHALPVLAQTL